MFQTVEFGISQCSLSATAELSEVSKVMNDLEVNVKELKVLDNKENRLCSKIV